MMDVRRTHLYTLEMGFVEVQQAAEGLAALPELLQRRLHGLVLQRPLLPLMQGYPCSSMRCPLLQ